MIVTAWNEGKYASSGGGYGLRFSAKDRDRHLRRDWGTIRLRVQEQPETWVEANVDKDCFWKKEITIIDQSIGQWLLKKGYARWVPHHPPKFMLTHLRHNEFSLVPHQLPAGLPCHERVDVAEWRAFEKAIREGQAAQVTQMVRQRCQALITRLKDYFRDAETGRIKCACCRWTRPEAGFRGDIIHMHHHNPVADAPEEGRLITWEEATRTFSPVCPRCHALLHAADLERCYEVDELRAILGH